jgi:hypothetical protein
MHCRYRSERALQLQILLFSTSGLSATPPNHAPSYLLRTSRHHATRVVRRSIWQCQHVALNSVEYAGLAVLQYPSLGEDGIQKPVTKCLLILSLNKHRRVYMAEVESPSHIQHIEHLVLH